MSRKANGYDKVRIYPRNMERLVGLQEGLAFKASIASIVNTALEHYLDTIDAGKKANRVRLNVPAPH